MVTRYREAPGFLSGLISSSTLGWRKSGFQAGSGLIQEQKFGSSAQGAGKPGSLLSCRPTVSRDTFTASGGRADIPTFMQAISSISSRPHAGIIRAREPGIVCGPRSGMKKRAFLDMTPQRIFPSCRMARPFDLARVGLPTPRQLPPWDGSARRMERRTPTCHPERTHHAQHSPRWTSRSRCVASLCCRKSLTSPRTFDDEVFFLLFASDPQHREHTEKVGNQHEKSEKCLPHRTVVSCPSWRVTLHLEPSIRIRPRDHEGDTGALIHPTIKVFAGHRVVQLAQKAGMVMPSWK